MKIRLRSTESQETLILEVPRAYTLPQLHQVLVHCLPPPPGSSFLLSLERRSPSADHLQRLVLASGDLVLYSLNRDGLASPGDRCSSNPSSSAGASDQVSQGHAGTDSESCPGLAQKVDVSGSTDPGNSASGSASVDFDVDGFAAVDETVVVRNKFSESHFLRRVLREELGGDGGDHILLVVAVHAVLLESGFVAVDPVTGIPAHRFPIPDQWPSTAFTMPLSYSLPELVAGRQSLTMPESVVLKFQSLGHFMTVYGSLAKSNQDLHRVCLDERRFAPTIDTMRVKGNDIGSSSSYSYLEKQVFEFWKIVKDGLALPLLIDLTQSVGLRLPSCFTCLSTELKLKIFESLSGIDLAKIECVCSELRYLTCNNDLLKYDLWKQKYVDEFGEPTESRGMINWKQSFTLSWEARKNRKRKRENSWWLMPSQADRLSYYGIRRDPNSFVVPRIVGGDGEPPPLFRQPSRESHRLILFPD